jgi:N-dimethylarginine dimethylaminohydrolase
MIKIKITNETAQLRAVLLGIANDFGGTPTVEECYDPKSKEHVKAGIFPCENDCISAMDILAAVFEKHNIKVYRPQNIKGLNQIFSRDIAFAIQDKLVLPNIIKDRRKEIEAIHGLLNQIPQSDKIKMPEDARAEGGDIIPWNEYIFVGYSEKEDFEKYTVARTNRFGLDFLVKAFPNKKVKGFELNKSDNNARENALHLDCCFQPIGKDMAILYKGGFKNEMDCNFLLDYFGKENIIEVSKEEMYNMNSNVFSISEKVIISEKVFTRLNMELRKRGFIVEEVPYAEIAKMSGLFRCSTMPLMRW